MSTAVNEVMVPMTAGMHICGGGGAPNDTLRVLSGLLSCCHGAAEDGPADCTCWEPEFDVDQAPIDPGLPVATRSAMCSDCAYRPDSPESTADDRYAERPTPGVGVFWCHQGIRKPVRWRHPLGITVECTGDYYQPPQVRDPAGNIVTYRADGTPAEQCAGWAAALAREVTRA
jgi:hypothetical protein